MKMRTEAEMEEAIAKHQLMGLLVGVIVVMIIVALTLVHPSKKQDRSINKACYEVCKVIANKDWKSDTAFLPRSKLLIKLRDCMGECRLENVE